jgi:hypothetical protein
MRRAFKSKKCKIRAGDRVTVRTRAEIQASLDSSDALEGLPFLPEMLKYCGHTFTVRRHVGMLIQEGVGAGMRRIKDVVLLNGTVCDGSAHGGCQRSCFPLWKTAWLTCSVDHVANPPEADSELVTAPLPPVEGRNCQVTELMRATTPLSPWNPLRHFLALSSEGYLFNEYARYLMGRIPRLVRIGFGSKLAGKKTSPVHTRPFLPDGLDLQPGDLVEVRSADEIQDTLDPSGRGRGLYFMPEMWAYCGRRLRVLWPVDRMMSEKTGEMRSLRQTVILDGITCDGKAHGGCQRGCYIFWKDVWLRRITDASNNPPP